MYRNDQLFRIFLEHTPAAIAMLDREMKYISVSRRYIQDYGLGDQVIIGRSHYEIFPEIPDKWKEIHKRCLSGAVERADEEPFLRRDGKIDWIRWEIHPWYENPGKIGGLIIFSEVITERKRIEKALKITLERLKFHVENSPLAVVEFDSEYKVSQWSTNAEKIFGWRAEEVIGKKINQLRWVYEDDIEKVAAISEDMNASKKTSNVHTNRNYRKDGSVITCEWYNSALIDEDGRLVSVLSLVLDITEREKAEEELRVALSALQRSNNDLEQFAYIVSHDLQEPLRMVSNFVKLLEKELRDNLDDKCREYINYITDGSRRMHTLIKDLLSFSRITTKGDAFTRIDVNEVMNDVLSNLKFPIEENNARIIYDKLPEVKADRTQLGQLFQNLISNAIKFKREDNPCIEISAEKKDKEWLFSIRDNGIGIDPKHFERIFVIFQRLNDRETYPGTGIGLSICKKILERHGGRIWVESTPGNGSVFYFTLPA